MIAGGAMSSSMKGLLVPICAYIVMAVSFVLVAILDVNVLLVIVGCALFGLVTSLIAGRRAG